MRAKRSKKYRKIMSSYSLHFSFRTPYQVLCDSNFLRQCHAFHMPVQKFLSNTLHGDARPYITQCSLAKAVADNASSKTRGRGDGKPVWLPPPTEVPLRYCKHKDDEGNEVGPIDEADCLVDLVSGQAKGNEARKNKNHYVLATAEADDAPDQTRKPKEGQNPRKRKRGVDVREAVRQVPGVPIVYVKRSVMVLEELSGASERVIRGLEKEKFKQGLIGDARNLKRKRGDDEVDSDEEDVAKQTGPQIRQTKKAKGPNPLSVRKRKSRPASAPKDGVEQGSGAQDDNSNVDGEHTKKRRKRRHRGKGGETQDTKSEAAVVRPSGTSVAADA